ncbi:hypothetical protein V5O48_016951 [Marasmius crinis-equi]|uniref:FAD-binding PCMH-type domain-containing protein n=1 Tax=Marasmius crinis-equi TaxID=585013 RepID=A0ABR3EQB9_9AGAR
MRLVFVAGLLVALAQSSDVSNTAEQTCVTLQQTLGPDIVQFRSTKAFQETVNGTWNLANAELLPFCVVFPKNTTVVQSAMKTIFENQVNYAIQSGGHSAMKGWNNVQDGVLIALSEMKEVSYDPEKDTITIQPGVRWGEALSILEPFGVAPVGGRQSDVGTGLILGGGLSFLSPSHGFAADSIKELDVVLADGTLVTATATNPQSDLLRALKGGGNRFGIVTRYELYPVHTGTKDDKQWVGGAIQYPSNSAEVVLKAMAHYVRDVTDPKAGMAPYMHQTRKPLVNPPFSVTLLTLLADTSDIIVTAYLFYNGTELPQNIFGEFLSAPRSSANISRLSYFDIANFLPPGNDTGRGERFGASAVLGDEDMFVNVYRLWSKYVSRFREEYGFMVLAFTPILTPQIQVGRDRGGNAIDPPLVSYAAIQVSEPLPLGVAEPSGDADEAKVQLLAQLGRPDDIPLFLNECDLRQNVYESYGDYEFLKRTYAKYDPSR